MSGIFPNSGDGGLAPNPLDLSNPAMAFAPTLPPINTTALYYGNGCDVRLRPEVINALISEMVAIADRGEVAYSRVRLNNAELGVRYMIQRGLPRGGIATGGPANYNLALDPT